MNKGLSSAASVTSATADPIRPRLALTVGITGHRPPRLPEEAAEAIPRTIGDVLKRMTAEMVRYHAGHRDTFAPEPPVLRMVSGLAEGADTMAAQAALDAGWALHACLPFTRDEYRQDFPEGDARATMEALCARAAGAVELPGSRLNEDAAYEAAGLAMLSLSDLLVAVWDGRKDLERGGTAEMVAQAVRRNIPVIHVQANGAATPEVIWTGLDTLPRTMPTLWTVARRPFDGEAGRLIDLLCGTPNQEPVGASKVLSALRARPSPWSRIAFAWPLLLRLLLLRAPRRPRSTPPAAAGADPAGDEGRIATLRRLADQRANEFASLHRSGFVLGFSLAAVAVLLAGVGAVHPWSDGSAPLWTVLGWAEVAVIAAILLTTLAGSRLGWHGKWLGLRDLAEHLRILEFALPLGEPLVRFDLGRSAGVLDWISWRARAAAREAGPPSLIVREQDIARMHAALIAAIIEQLDYHERNGRLMSRLDHRLHRFGLISIALTFAASAVVALHHGSSAGAAMGVTKLLTIALPAVGSAVYGIRAQGDFTGSRDRSRATADRLGQLIEAVRADPLHYDLLAERMRQLAGIMLSETADWRLNFEGRPLTLPA